MIIMIDSEKYYYEKIADSGCSTNMKVLIVLIVVCVVCGLLLFALLYVVLSRAFTTLRRTPSFRKAEIRTISNPLPLNVHPYSRRYSYQKCNSNVCLCFQETPYKDKFIPSA